MITEIPESNKKSSETKEREIVPDMSSNPLPLLKASLLEMATPPPIHEEHQYLDLIRRVIEHGEYRKDRTGTGTLSIFAPSQLRFSLRDNILPLLTTKRVFTRAIIEELLWFIKGDTNSKHLTEKGVHIWDGNGSREYLDKIGLSHRKEGDLGPVYGFQWRHFGAEYIDCDTDYSGKGVDQLQEVIDKIKNSPNDRRIILSAWNPADLKKMALPPCHMFCQFYVSNTKRLSCLLYQRSCDIGLGVPFNITSYAILTHMIAHVTGCSPGEFIHTMGDAHIYNDHIDALKAQIKREPKAFPRLEFRREINNIDDFKYDDFIITGYEPHPQIKMKMSVSWRGKEKWKKRDK